MKRADHSRTGAEPGDRIVMEEGTSDQRRKSLAERWVWWVWWVWWTGIKGERLRSPEASSAIRLCSWRGIAWHH